MVYVDIWREKLKKEKLEEEFGKYEQIGEYNICMKKGNYLRHLMSVFLSSL